MANEILGQVAKIGEAGNLITDIPIEKVKDIPHGESLSIRFGDHETLGLYPAEHGLPDTNMVASLGKSGFVEIEIVGINLAEMLGIKVNEPVTLRW